MNLLYIVEISSIMQNLGCTLGQQLWTVSNACGAVNISLLYLRDQSQDFNLHLDECRHHPKCSMTYHSQSSTPPKPCSLWSSCSTATKTDTSGLLSMTSFVPADQASMIGDVSCSLHCQFCVFTVAQLDVLGQAHSDLHGYRACAQKLGSSASEGGRRRCPRGEDPGAGGQGFLVLVVKG